MLLVERVVGTEKYVNIHLERDIRDVTKYMIIENEDKECCDKVILENSDRQVLEDIRHDIEMSEASNEWEHWC